MNPITRLFALLALAAPALAADAPRYNVLLIMADDLRPAMSCYGDAQAKTPHLDRLAARGVRFDRAYVQYPVCNPSRVSMLTGTRPEQNGITGNATFFREKMPDIVTLPQLFRQHGATALSYGKIYHAGLVEGDTENRFLDNGKSWDEAKMFRPTKLGNTGPRRNLTGGNPKVTIPNTDEDATVLGEGQWAWFERRLREPAEIRVVISSIQLISAEHGSEKWENFPKERARFLELLRRTQAQGVVVISGDRHLAELSALTPADGAPYPLYDLTTSGLNQPVPQKPEPKEGNPKEPETKPAAPKKPQPNRHRLHERPYTGSNFGLMRVKWDGPNPSLRLEVCGLEGGVVIARDIPFSEIHPN